MSLQEGTKVNERIGLKMVEDKDFCLSIVNCKDRDEVKEFLKSNGIDASDADIEDLARNILEIADICSRVDDNELEKIVGGVKGAGSSSSSSSSSDSTNAGGGGQGSGDTVGLWKGLGIAGMTVGGLGVLLVVASGIKKLGDKKGWWQKKKA